MVDFNGVNFPTFLSRLSHDEIHIVRHFLIKEEKRRKYPTKLERNNLIIPDNFIDLIPKKGKPLKPLPFHNQNWNYKDNISYLPCLMQQDWSFLFDGIKTVDEPIYYVYAHVKPEGMPFSQGRALRLKGQPFYIGKGKGQRAYDLNRNQGHGKILRSLLSKGVPPDKIVNIIKENITERAALEIESKLIYFFGTKYEDKRKNGILMNLNLEKRPMFGCVSKEPRTTIIRKQA